MAKPPRATAPKIKPMVKIAIKVAPKPVSKPTNATAATLARAERIQGMEAGESRLARAMPPKNKPATPTMSPAATAATKATLARAERIQREEAGESAIMRSKPSVVRTTTNYRPTPTKKK